MGLMMIEVNGIAHIVLTVNRFKECADFYSKILAYMGLKEVFRGKDNLYYVGGKTAIAISRSHKDYEHEKFVQGKIGLHHICFRAKNRKDIDDIHAYLKSIDALIIQPPQEGPWAPGYYSILFECPDGIRLELNHIPGKGILEPGKNFNPSDDYC